MSLRKSAALMLLAALFIWCGLGFYMFRLSEKSKPEPFPENALMGDLRCTLPAQTHPSLSRGFINVRFPPGTGIKSERGVFLMAINPGAKSLAQFTLDDYLNRSLAGKASFVMMERDEKKGFETYEYVNFEGKDRSRRVIFAKDAKKRWIMMRVRGIDDQMLQVRREFSKNTEIDYLIPYEVLRNFDVIDSEITDLFEKNCS